MADRCTPQHLTTCSEGIHFVKGDSQIRQMDNSVAAEKKVVGNSSL